jgi:hypothetical protein
VILGCIDPVRGCPSFYGKKGLKAQRGCSSKKIRDIDYPLDAHPKVPREMK